MRQQAVRANSGETPTETTATETPPVDTSTKVWAPSKSELSSYDKLSTQTQQENFINKYIMPKFKDLNGIRKIIRDCLLRFGISPKQNPFLDFITKLSKMPDAKTYQKNMQYVYDSYRNNQLKLDMPVLTNNSLYERNFKDFQYSLNAFSLFSDKKRVATYLKDPKVANVAQFMTKDGTVKPAGIDGREGDTIFNVIEEWAGNGNEYTPDEIASNKEKTAKDGEKKPRAKKDSNKNKYVLEDVYPQKDWSYELFKGEIEKAFKHTDQIKPKNNDKNAYLEKLYIAFEYPKLLEVNTLNAILNTKNRIVKKEGEEVTLADAKQFGYSQNKPDEPVYIKVQENGNTTKGLSGIFVFNKFVPLDKDNQNALKQQSATYLRDMELKTFIKTNDRVVDTLNGLLTILDQVGVQTVV